MPLERRLTVAEPRESRRMPWEDLHTCGELFAVLPESWTGKKKSVPTPLSFDLAPVIRQNEGPAIQAKIEWERERSN
jgi:hypothetical protein